MHETAGMELLQQYVGHGSEEAFAALVSRYINLVYSAALRKTSNPDAAEEITQAVFTILAIKARVLPERTILSGWLYQTARLTAAHFLRTDMRRIRREQEACMASLSNEPESEAWEEIAPVLEDAMGRLGARDRDVLVLRFFEGKSFREVGAALGASENAAKKRVAYALEKLRRYFVRRGISSTTAALAGAISAHAVQAAPATLAKATVVVAIANGATGSTSTLALLKGALKVMAWTKAKTGIVSAIVVAGVVAPFIVRYQAQAKLRENDDVLQKQSRLLASTQAEYERLSALAANSELSQEQLNDLHKLRGAVGPLRQQANEVAQLQKENRQLRAKTGQDKPKTALQKKEEAVAKLNYGKNWAIAFYQFAAAHRGQFPTNFEQAAAFAPDKLRNQSHMTADQFEIVFQGSPSSLSKPQDVIVLREKEPWNAGASSHPQGKWAKIYTFAEGHSEIHHESSNNFDDYEKAYVISPPTDRQ